MAKSKAGAPLKCREVEVVFDRDDVLAAIKTAYGDRVLGGIAVSPPTIHFGATFVALELVDVDLSPVADPPVILAAGSDACQLCDGTGVVTDECSDCKGTGKVDP